MRRVQPPPSERPELWGFGEPDGPARMPKERCIPLGMPARDADCLSWPARTEHRTASAGHNTRAGGLQDSPARRTPFIPALPSSENFLKVCAGAGLLNFSRFGEPFGDATGVTGSSSGSSDDSSASSAKV